MAEPTGGDGTVLFNIDASLAGIKTQLAEVSKLSGQAGKTMAANISGQLNALQTALAKTRTSTQGATTSMTGLVRQLNDVGVQAAAGTPPLMILIQQGEQLAFAFKEAGGASGVLQSASVALASKLGPVAIGAAALATVAGAVAIAYKAWNEDSERVAAVADLVRTAHAQLEPTLRATELATIDLRVAMGWLSKEEGDLAKNGIAAFGQLTNDIKPLQTQVNELRKDQGTLFRQWIDFGNDLPVLGPVVDAVTTSIGEQGATINALNQQIDESVAAHKHLREERDLVISKAAMDKEAEEAAAEAKRRAAAAAAALAAQLREEQKAYDALQRAIEANYEAYDLAQSSIDSLKAASHAAVEDALSDTDKIIDKRDDALAEQLRVYNEGRAAAANNADQLAEIDQAYFDAKVDIATAANVELAKMETARREKEAKEAEKAKKKQADTFAAVQGLASQLATYAADSTAATYGYIVDNLAKTQAYATQVDEYLTESQKEELDKRIEAQKAAARKAFETNKAAELASATINGIGAAVAAWNAGMESAPGPFALATAAAFTAASVLATGAQITAIASQSPAFHSGGLAPDERMSRTMPGEFWVSRQGVSAAGRENLDRLNAGVSPGGGDVYAITTFRHTGQVTRYERERLDRNSPTMQEITKGRTPGVRAL